MEFNSGFKGLITQQDAVCKIKTRETLEGRDYCDLLPEFWHCTHTCCNCQYVLLCSYTTLVSVFRLCQFVLVLYLYSYTTWNFYEYPIRWDESRIIHKEKIQQDATVYQNFIIPYLYEPHVQQPSTYEKPETASAVLGSWWWAVCRPKHVELHINIE